MTGWSFVGELFLTQRKEMKSDHAKLDFNHVYTRVFR